MPAPKSILTEKPKPYAPVTNAIAIYEKTLHICLKMPKRYTYLILQDVIRLAGEVMDNTKKANSVFANYGYYIPVKAITRQQKQSIDAVDNFLTHQTEEVQIWHMIKDNGMVEKLSQLLN